MKLLFVCTGNTCRSPMAQELARALAARYGLELAVSSAGLSAIAGQQASEGARRAMAERGLTLTGHRARRFRPDMAEGAQVLAMTCAHAAQVRKRAPKACVLTLGEWAGSHEEVMDPYGADADTYDRCAAQLERLIAAGLDGYFG